MKKAMIILFYILLSSGSVQSQHSFFFELGPQYNVILADQYPGLLKSFYSNATGLNFSFLGVANKHNSSIVLNFSYNEFKFKRDAWRSKYYTPHNSRLYDLSIQFKTYLLTGKFSPYFLIGPGIHFMNWGDVQYAPPYSGTVDDIAPSGASTSELMLHIGLGIRFSLAERLGLLFESSVILSKSYYLLPVSTRLAYNL